MELKDINAMLDVWGYVALEQECSWGETRIILCENELDKESAF